MKEAREKASLANLKDSAKTQARFVCERVVQVYAKIAQSSDGLALHRLGLDAPLKECFW